MTTQTAIKQTSKAFGIDLGMGALKLCGYGGGMQLPAHVATESAQVVGNLAGMTSKTPPPKIKMGRHSFYVGLGAHEWGRPVENLAYDRLTGSPEMNAILYGAFTNYMAEHGPILNPVSLMVGMPLEPLSGTREETEAVVNAVRGWMMGVHEWQANGRNYTLEVAEVKVTSQPTGAFFDFLLDDEGKINPKRTRFLKKEVGIVSIGFNTVELLVLENNAPVQRFTGGSTSGVRRLLDIVNGDGLYSLGELDGRLRSGNLLIDGAIPIWSREVTGQIERKWGKQWNRFGQIVIVGGGAILLRDHLIPQFNGKTFVPDDPVLSIARGLYKLSLMQQRKRS